MDIRKAQKECLLRLLNLNSSVSDALTGGDEEEDENDMKSSGIVWKVLVYDKACQDILSPIISVGDLRKLGITLNLLITSRRERVPEVPAVYFVAPTRENVDLIAKDCARGIYDALYLNFSTSLPRNLLEDLALSTVETSSGNRISRVMDQFTHFVSLDSGLFSLNVSNSYARLNAVQDDTILQCVDQIVDSLFSLFVTLGVIPMICTRPGEAAEMVARKLDSQIRTRSDLFLENSSSSFQRPMLILLDRNVDLQVALHHTWTYQALAHDLLALNSNRVLVEVEDERGTSRRKEYFLDENDEFWAENGGEPFGEVAKKISALASDYKKSMDELNANPNDLEDMTSGLASAINSLPEMQRRKMLVDTHTNMATSMMKAINERELDALFAMEERMTASGLFPDSATLLARLQPEAKGTSDDKLRLLLLYYLAKDEVPASQLAELQAALESSGASRSALDYLRKVRMMHRIATGQHDNASASSGSSLLGDSGMKAFDRGLGWLKGNVKNLLPVKHKLPLTRIVAELMQGNRSSRTNAYKFLDPRSSSKKESARSMGASEAVVVVVGGGSFVELQNLRDWSSSTSSSGPMKVMYGATEMISPQQMLRQLESLSNPTEPNLT